MYKIRVFLTAVLITFLINSGISQGHHVRIGTIGNSITHGIALPSPLTQAFPVLLDDMLADVYGDTCIVQNFGLTTTTMLKNGDVSYWDTQHLKDYLAYAPEICFIMLGTNDTKPQNWDIYGEEFIGDFIAMIDTIQHRNPSTRFILAYPPPAYAVEWGIRDSVILHGVIPAVDSLLKVVDDAILMDFYYPLLDSVDLFPDNIHPNIQGNVVMAKMLMERIIESDLISQADTGYTFITEFSTSTNPIAKNSSADLSWLTINANSTYLNDVLVDNQGSIEISPEESTTYTLVAKGKKSNDTLELFQEVYIPDLARLKISPSKITRSVGDSIYFEASQYDQFNRKLTHDYFDVDWSIVGSGSLIQETDTSVIFVCVSPDTSYLSVSYNGDFPDEARVIVKSTTSSSSLKTDETLFSVYPNPANNQLNISTELNGRYTVEIHSLSGQEIFRTEMKEKSSKIDLSTFRQGIYFITFSSKEFIRTEKIIKL